MRRILFLFLFSFLLADTEIKDINFTDTELNMTLLTLNHIDYYTLKYYINDWDLSKCIIDWRYDNRGINNLDDFNQLIDDCEIYKKAIYNLKQCSYKFSEDLIVNPVLGTTYPLTNFLYGLAGILIGFAILLGIILAFF